MASQKPPSSSILTARLEQQLKNLKVFRVDSLVLQRTVKHEGKIYQGNDDLGRAILQEGPDGLEVYLEHEKVYVNDANLILINKLGEACGLKDRGMKLLPLILMTGDVRAIQEMLEGEGIDSVTQNATTANLQTTDDGGEADVPDARALQGSRHNITATGHELPIQNSKGINVRVRQSISQWSTPASSHAASNVMHVGSIRPSSRMDPQSHIAELVPVPASPNPNRESIPTLERSIRSIEEAADAFNTDDLTLTFLGNSFPHEEYSATRPNQITSDPYVTFGQYFQSLGFSLPSEANASHLPLLDTVRPEAPVLPNTERPGPANNSIYNFSSIMEALPRGPQRISRSLSSRHILTRTSHARLSSYLNSNPFVPRTLGHGRSSSSLRLNSMTVDIDPTTVDDPRTTDIRESDHKIGLDGEIFVGTL